MEVVTFYSYKGGVGRTLLLAWMARALAARGKRVLALDLDLEAPGLPTKLRPTSEPRAGFGVVDLLLRFQGGASPPTDLAQWCLPVATEQGRLWLLPAGAAPSPAYWQALSKISWESLFAERAADGARFFLWLRDALGKAMEPDFLFVDARTGVTEMGAAAVGLLADAIVAVTNTSPESKMGLREVLRAAVGNPRPSRPPLRILPVLSRVPALLGADDDARLVDQLQRVLNEEAEPLTSTLAIERVLVVHHEEVLLEDEQRVLAGPRLRVSADYDRVLAWLVREAMPGPTVDLSLPRSSHLLETVRAQEEIVAAYRESAERAPTSYMPLLADALASTVRSLMDLGHREDALAGAKEAVAIHRQLAKQQPNRYVSPLANSLIRLGFIQSELGQREEALRSTTEAVAHYRDLVKQEVVDVRRGLAEQRPDALAPNLAAALNNLGAIQSKLGRREEALRATQEAVETFRGLVEQRHDAFLPDLARALDNLGADLESLGRREEALRATQEAAETFRGLAEQRPEAFLPDLARALNNLGMSLSNLGQREEALRATQEAVETFRRLAEERPDTFLPNLASALNNLGIRLGNLDRREEALRATQEAVETFRRLAEERPDAVLPDLASALNNLGGMLSNLGRREEALRATQEAVDLRRSLAEQRPDAFLPDLASSLNNLGVSLSNLGQREEALRATQEAVEVYLPFVQRWPGALSGEARRSLSNYLGQLEQLGRSPDTDPLVLRAREILGDPQP